MLKKKDFPTNLVDKCMKIFLHKQFSKKILEHTVPQKRIIYSATISWYAFPLFENTFTKKPQ